MNEIKVFNNEEFGEIRTVTINNEPWFVGKDVAEILGYANASKAVLAHVDEEDKTFLMLDIADSQNRNVSVGQSKTALINESGLYSLILSSKLPTARKFKRWVTSEVLPSIRKNGGYIANQENLSSEQILANAVVLAKNVIAEHEKLITEMKPKALFADAVATSNTSILIGDLAKILTQNGVNIGQKRLFDWMRDKGYLIKQKGTSWNMPTQRSMEMGLFEVKESTINNPDGSVRITKTTKITGKGQQYFINKFFNN